MSNVIIQNIPTLFFKKVKYDDIITNYQNGKYGIMPEFKTTNTRCIGTLTYKDGKIIGFKTVINKMTLILIRNTPTLGICAHCESSTLHICSVGIPERLSKTVNPDNSSTINIYVNGEMCSWECVLACTKKMGKTGISLNPKYMDVNAIIYGVFSLYFPDKKLEEAPGIMEFQKYGGTLTPANFKEKIHLYHETTETKNIGSPKLVLKN